MKGITAAILAAVIVQAFGNLLDIFEQEGQHEPRVAINCGHVPFHADSKTGKWVSGNNGVAICDTNKDDVKRYCQKAYPNLNITNIVEANKETKIKNWCKQGSKQCTTEKKVVPYRCLVDEYEADALMVPKGCKFNHLHDQDSCMTHDEWKMRAFAFCRRENMKLNEYGILLSCGTDMFTGVEFVCCPKKHGKKKMHRKKQPQPTDRVAFEKAIKDLQKFLPVKSEGCDRTLYEGKRQKLEDRHSRRIAAVVDEWDEVETRYKKLKVQDSDAAKEKMNKTLKAFKETLRVLERDAKEERDRLKTEHSNCITTNINKQKRDAMLAYLAAVEQKPHSAKMILRTARKFFKECEHDRLHSLRHFQHVRVHNPNLAEEMRSTLLEHLHGLNQVVNASINLLSYLPDVAKKFGLEAFIKLENPQVPKLVDPVHNHNKLPKKFLDAVQKIKNQVTKEKVPSMKIKPTEAVSEKGVDEEEYKKIPSKEEKYDGAFENDSKSKLASGTTNPTDLPPKTQYDSDGMPEREDIRREPVETPSMDKPGKIKVDEPVAKKTHDHGHLFFKHPKSPAAFAAVIGLSCGALVIMLGSIIALVMRRNRANQSHVVVVDAEPEDQEHLVKMQKSGYENPTYKFFYY